jgi:hypothetical protein
VHPAQSATANLSQRHFDDESRSRRAGPLGDARGARIGARSLHVTAAGCFAREEGFTRLR